MKSRFAFVAAFVVAALPVAAWAAPLGTAFTYQGRLEKTGSGMNASVNLQFALYDALTAGAQIGATQTINGVTVTNGVFTVTIDFGAGAFNGNARWMEIGVQGPGDVSFTTLTPRQSLTPAPYAMYAASAGGAALALPFNGSSNTPNAPSLQVTNTATTGIFSPYGIVGNATAHANGYGVKGAGSLVGVEGVGGYGVSGTGTTYGVYGSSNAGTAVFGVSVDQRGVYGLHSDNTGDDPGVYGETASGSATSAGTFGIAINGRGVQGSSTNGPGVYGSSTNNDGISGFTSSGNRSGVFGQTSASPAAGVTGRNDSGTPNGQGVFGYASGGAVGMLAVSEGNDGLSARTNAAGKSAVFGYTEQSSSFAGYFFNNSVGGVALHAEGLAEVKVLKILGGADLAERFDVDADAEPGTVMAIDPAHPGRVEVCREAMCHRVAGVVSGARDLRAGVTLGEEPGARRTAALALTGRVWVKADAASAPIHPGDLLTTGARPGHAVAVADRDRATGAILGKAMSSLERGTGMVLVLVSLQ